MDRFSREIDNYAENLIAMLIEDSIELLPRSKSRPEYIKVIQDYIEGFRQWDVIPLVLEIAIVDRVLDKASE